MTGLLLVFKAEAYRHLHAHGTWIAGLFLAVVAALRVLAARAAEAAARAEALAAGRTLPSGEGGTGWAPLVEGWRTGLAAGTLLLLIHAARVLAADRESGLLRLGSTRSTTRSALVLGRALLAPILILAAFAITGLAALGASVLLYDFGPLLEDGFELATAQELRYEITLAALAALPPLLATYAFGLFVSACGRSAVTAISTALTLFLAFDLFKEVLGPGQYWVFAAYVPSLVDRSLLMETAGVARGFSDAGYPAALLQMNFVLPWPEALALVILACWVLSRRSL